MFRLSYDRYLFSSLFIHASMNVDSVSMYNTGTKIWTFTMTYLQWFCFFGGWGVHEDRLWETGDQHLFIPSSPPPLWPSFQKVCVCVCVFSFRFLELGALLCLQCSTGNMTLSFESRETPVTSNWVPFCHVDLNSTSPASLSAMSWKPCRCIHILCQSCTSPHTYGLFCMSKLWNQGRHMSLREWFPCWFTMSFI